MFLTPTELHALTGYQKPKLQRQWLVDNGYRFDVRADGRPAVLAAQIEARQSGPRRVTSRVEPNWSVLE